MSPIAAAPSAPSAPRGREAGGAGAGGAFSVDTGGLQSREPAHGTPCFLFPDAPECAPGRLLAARDREEPGLPALADTAIVLEEEPEHHVDARMPPDLGERQCDVAGLRREADAESTV